MLWKKNKKRGGVVVVVVVVSANNAHSFRLASTLVSSISRIQAVGHSIPISPLVFNMPHHNVAIFLFVSLVVLASCAPQPQQCLDCLESATNCLTENDQCLGVNMQFQFCYYQQQPKSKFFQSFSSLSVEIPGFNSFISFVGVFRRRGSIKVLARANFISLFCFQGSLYFLTVLLEAYLLGEM